VRITDDMLTRFEDYSEISRLARNLDEVARVGVAIREGLAAVAPMIAEAAVSGFIEQGARLKEAERLLRRVLDPERNEPVFRDIQTFLGLL
jgi:hypothetical protein